MLSPEVENLLFPAIDQPNQSGYISTEDREHELYFEEYGNPQGIPVVYLHGGPGAGLADYYARYFDPDVFRIILYDQRCAAKSKPYGVFTTTPPLLHIEDLETLRKALGIDKFHLVGGSWGTTIAILYAQKYPKNTLSIVLRAVFLCRRNDINKRFSRGFRRFPEYARGFLNALPERIRSQIDCDDVTSHIPLIEKSFFDLVMHNDPEIYEPAAIAWTLFELRTCFKDKDSVLPDDMLYAGTLEAKKYMVDVARGELDLSQNYRQSVEDTILKDCPLIGEIPVHIIHGRYDTVCTPDAAIALYRACQSVYLDLVPGGHGATDIEIVKAILRAMESIKEDGMPFAKRSDL